MLDTTMTRTFLALLVTSATATAQTPLPDATEVLRQAQATAQRTLHLSATVVANTRSSAGGAEVIPFVPNVNPVEWARDGDRYRMRVWSKVKKDDGSFYPATIELFTGSEYWTHLNLFDGDGALQQVHTSVYRGPRFIHPGMVGARFETGQVLDGILYGDFEDAFTILLRHPAAVAIEAATVDGHACLRISARVPEGEYELWVDPAIGHALRKSVVRKKTVPGSKPFTPVLLWEHYEATVSDVQFETIDGHQVPKSGKLTITGAASMISSTFRDREEWTFLRTDMKLGARLSDADLRLDLPEGARIGENNDEVVYVLTAGKAVSTNGLELKSPVLGH